jgi:hypothetical protein
MKPAPRLLLLTGLWALLALPLLVIPGIIAVTLWWALGALSVVIALLDLWHARRHRRRSGSCPPPFQFSSRTRYEYGFLRLACRKA